MKLLNLILYSETIPEYVEMKEILESYLNKLNKLQYYFYCYNEELDKEYEIKDKIIYIKGKETFIPGILEKTIKVFEICNELGIEYDYIIRSNISTIINYPSLQQYLLVNTFNKYDYIGCMLTTGHSNKNHKYYKDINKPTLIEKRNTNIDNIVNVVNSSKDAFNNIHNSIYNQSILQMIYNHRVHNRLPVNIPNLLKNTTEESYYKKNYDINFAFGMCIILSNKIIKTLIDNKDKLDYTIIDDISIGIFCKNNNIELHNIECIIENADKFYYSKLIFRNKSKNRQEDISRMKLITNSLIDNLSIQNMI